MFSVDFRTSRGDKISNLDLLAVPWKWAVMYRPHYYTWYLLPLIAARSSTLFSKFLLISRRWGDLPSTSLRTGWIHKGRLKEQPVVSIIWGGDRCFIFVSDHHVPETRPYCTLESRQEILLSCYPESISENPPQPGRLHWLAPPYKIQSLLEDLYLARSMLWIEPPLPTWSSKFSLMTPSCGKISKSIIATSVLFGWTWLDIRFYTSRVREVGRIVVGFFTRYISVTSLYPSYLKGVKPLIWARIWERSSRVVDGQRGTASEVFKANDCLWTA